MGINATYLSPRKSYADKKRILASIHDGETSILYVPINSTFDHWLLSEMRHVPGGLRLLVVDEADHLSQSGPRYRETYDHVAPFSNAVPAHTVLCLANKVTKEITKDVCATFKIDDTSVIQSLYMLPAHLELRVVHVRRRHDKYAAILSLLVCPAPNYFMFPGLYVLRGRSAPFKISLEPRSLLQPPHSQLAAIQHLIAPWKSTRDHVTHKSQ